MQQNIFVTLDDRYQTTFRSPKQVAKHKQLAIFQVNLPFLVYEFLCFHHVSCRSDTSIDKLMSRLINRSNARLSASIISLNQCHKALNSLISTGLIIFNIHQNELFYKYFKRSVMKFLIVLVFALLTSHVSAQCNSTQLDSYQPLSDCTFAGYNLTALTLVDLYGLESSQQYVYRLCGAVSNPLCPSGSTACQFATSVTTCNNNNTALQLMSSSAVQRFGYINSSNPAAGIQITQVTPGAGPSCANAMNRTIVTNIQCADGPAVPTRITTITKSESGCTCSITITFSSPLACPANMTRTITPVSLPMTRLPCTMGQFGIDLRSQFSDDLQLTTSSSASNRYVLNLCRPTQDLGCNLATNGPAVAACVVPRCANISATALMYNYQTPTWHYTNYYNNSDGYTMVNYNSVTNFLVVRLTCNISATSPQLISITQTASGHHHIYLATSLACVNETMMFFPKPRCNLTCCFSGYDFRALKTADITGYQNNGLGQPWSFSMCGAARANCNGAMICQKPNCPYGSGSWPLAYYKPAVLVDTHFSWVNGLDFTGGLRMVTANGQMCGAYPRTTIVELICDPTAAFPRADRAAEDAVCVYTLTVRTIIVCAPPRYLGGGANLGEHNVTGNGVALIPVKPIFGCQFAGYDFSPLAQSDFHVKIWPYMFIARLCGEQNNVVCTNGANRNTSICQIDYGCKDTPGSQFVVSLWNPYLVQYEFIDGSWENGVTQRLKTGDMCPGNVPRSIIYDIVCDLEALTPYQDQGFESPGSYICNYYMRIRTNIVCTAPPALLLGNMTVSSSSTGRWWYPQSNSALSRSVAWALIGAAVTLALATS